MVQNCHMHLMHVMVQNHHVHFNACDGSEPSHAHLASGQYKLLHWTLTTKIRDTYIPNFGRTEGPRDSQNHKF
jgi:hypothetical protein